MSDPKRIPKHVAIIMDGNGRWAQNRGYPRFYGHVRGAGRVREVVRESKRQGVRALTLYAFSTENWKRPEGELQVLWKLLRKYIRKEIEELDRNGVRLNVIGEMDRLPVDAKKELNTAIQRLSKNSDLFLTFALSYGSRSEWVQASRRMAQDCLDGLLKPEDINEDQVNRYLSTSVLGDYSDVDLVIRTSGEKRISNFLLWQSSYAEFDFPITLWPDYTVDEYKKSLLDYSSRDRRYGGLQK
jgi:undecaprenyl diphosphate synthase